jgi:antitoxin ParD1/3/4
MKAWVDSRMQGGRYGNAGDSVRDLIRRDQERQQGIAELQGLITEGLESGPAQPLDPEAFLKDMREKHARRQD